MSVITAPRSAAFRTLTMVACWVVTAWTTAHAQDAPPERARGLAGWLPGAAVELAIHAQQFDAEGTSSFEAGDQGKNTVSTLLARLEASLASPPIPRMPGNARVIIRAGASIPTGETVTVASSPGVGFESELGTSLQVSWKTMWHTGLDLRFKLPIEEYQIYLQPGIEYLGSRFRYEPGFTFRAEPGSPGAAQSPNPLNPPRFEFRGRSAPIVSHFIGPTLAVEAGFVEVGPITFSGYLQGRLYWLVGDRATNVRFSGDLNGNPETGSGRLESNFLAGQVGFGFRGSF